MRFSGPITLTCTALIWDLFLMVLHENGTWDHTGHIIILNLEDTTGLPFGQSVVCKPFSCPDTPNAAYLTVTSDFIYCKS